MSLKSQYIINFAEDIDDKDKKKLRIITTAIIQYIGNHDYIFSYNLTRNDRYSVFISVFSPGTSFPEYQESIGGIVMQLISQFLNMGYDFTKVPHIGMGNCISGTIKKIPSFDHDYLLENIELNDPKSTDVENDTISENLHTKIIISETTCKLKDQLSSISAEIDILTKRKRELISIIDSLSRLEAVR